MDEIRSSLDQMRAALDKMTGADAHLLSALPGEATATRAWLEATIPAWDQVSQNSRIEPSFQWGVLLSMNDGLRKAIFDLEKRVIALESN